MNKSNKKPRSAYQLSKDIVLVNKIGPSNKLEESHHRKGDKIINEIEQMNYMLQRRIEIN